MADPIEELEGAGAPVWDLPTAADVRRRGERIARRRAGWAAVAGTAVAAALVVPLALGGAPDRPDRAVVATDGVSPTVPVAAWSDTVPAGFPVAAGMGPDPVVAAAGEELIRTTTVCGESRWVRGLPAGAGDGLVATGEGEQRMLLVYPDAELAHDALAAARRGVSACGDDRGGRRLALSDDVGGDESWMLELERAGGTETVVVLRVGNAVLLDHATVDAPDPAARALRGTERVGAVARAMCVFAENPCRG